MKKIFILFLGCVFIQNHLFAQLIHISTQENSLIFQVTKQKKVMQSHYGKLIKNTQGLEDMAVVFNEAYPSFGNGNNDEVALIATHDDGTMATDLFYKSHQQEKEDNIQKTVIHLKDDKKELYVDLHFKAYAHENVIEQWIVVHNKEKKEISLSQFASSAIGFKATDYYLSHFYGSHSKEMMISEERLTNGIKIIETKRGVRTTEYENPTFMLSLNGAAKESHGEVIAGALAWSGNFRLAFQVDDKARCQMISGINSFASTYHLASGENFETPRMILTYSDEGKNKASINLHRWAKKYNLRAGNELRPIVLNSWEGAYFKFDADKLKNMMDGAAEMGVEVFVLDDGWFGNKYPRNNAKAGLGDWQVNQKKLPKGLDDLIDYTAYKGMRFGIWVEPEMVNPKSELAEKHPDWIVQRQNDRKMLLERNQLLLDLSNPKVQDFVFNVVDRLLTTHPKIAYVKWDANRHVQNFGSTYLSEKKQSHLFINYTRGLENVLKRLEKKYPSTIFQACASGGGRVDFSSMKHTHEFWASDDTDPYERLFIQWGTNHFYPPIATAAHVTKSPNHQTHRETSLKFRFDVAMAGRLGIELRPDDLDEKEVKFAKKAIALYKDIRPIVQFGDLYRLLSPYDEDGYAAINYVAPSKKEALLMVYSHEHHRRYERNFVKMQGLDPSLIYEVEEINTDSKKSHISFNHQLISGEILMNRGIWVDLRRPLESAVFKISETK
ncbi:alpha-galactosidase [Wenyingzhuangia sp. 2_MG-2023]|uniref:alpha-galactosidase n=1 Tax=Wenyingzhuangia sp. 2_MG-2023 TaxID=3062639 RepID=UPI0026E24654|nr:alpha-galactosidase [Wenyingzhuangia sp. 2_MG-2023]MDO6739325.1 alpha-galactosidase [Wenyingzhuangia sp. 2_MG-2023]